MQAFFVASNLADGLYGPCNKPIANRVLKIVRMASDEKAELEVAEVDRLASSSRSGLLPFMRTNNNRSPRERINGATSFQKWKPK
jgi:hypothetical protein